MLPLRSNKEYDLWRCTACGAPKIFSRPPGLHAGPRERGLDLRYAFAPCWRVSEGGWEFVKQYPHPKGEVVIFRHDSRPQSPQPKQPSSLETLPSVWKDPSRTYGEFPGHRAVARRGRLKDLPERPVDVPLVARTDGRSAGWIRPVAGVPLSEGAESSPSPASSPTPELSWPEGLPLPEGVPQH